MKTQYKFVQRKLRIIFLISFLILSGSLRSEFYFDSQGKDFWFTFIPNYHNCASSPNTCQDSIFVFVTSEFPAKGKISYYDSFGAIRTQNFQINDPRIIYTFKLDYRDYELQSYNNSGADWG
ncbi:MAG: hypothetical protein Q8M94_08505, partial [Ignavibacteria bacterium]|nr:hypothetical protein [Ignavibacteria bacterium]